MLWKESRERSSRESTREKSWIAQNAQGIADLREVQRIQLRYVHRKESRPCGLRRGRGCEALGSLPRIIDAGRVGEIEGLKLF